VAKESRRGEGCGECGVGGGGGRQEEERKYSSVSSDNRLLIAEVSVTSLSLLAIILPGPRNPVEQVKRPLFLPRCDRLNAPLLL